MKHLLVLLLALLASNITLDAQTYLSRKPEVASANIESIITTLRSEMQKSSWTLDETVKNALLCHENQRQITIQQPVLPAQFSREIHRRFLTPALSSKNEIRTMAYCRDWMKVAYLYESDEKRMQQAVDIVEKNMKMFIDNYNRKVPRKDVEAFQECMNTLHDIDEDDMADVDIFDYKEKQVAKMGVTIPDDDMPEFCHFVTKDKPLVVEDKGRILLGEHTFTFPKKKFTATVEKLDNGAYRINIVPKKKKK